MADAPLIDIRPDHWAIVQRILQKHVPHNAVWAFGSRAKWEAKQYSDLDLAVITDKPLPLNISASLSDDFSESDLPYKVDVVDWATTSESFRKIMERDKVVVQAGEKGLGRADGWLETPYGRFAFDFTGDRLANLCDSDAGIQTGPFGSQLHQKDYVQIGTPIITVEHLEENRILHEHLPKVCDADRDRLSRYQLRRGDIVFSRVDSVDRCALVREAEDGWLFSGRCLRVRPNPTKIDSEYLSYFFGLTAFKEHIRAIAVGATMPSLNTTLLSDVFVPYPLDIKEQKAIGHILGSLDDKINHNCALAANLEAIARRLFKSWFVDFDPVRAKAAGEKPLGLAEDIAALFPDQFVDSELGEIPEGWKVGKISDFSTNVRVGCTPSRFSCEDFYVGLEHFDRRCLTLWNGGSGDDATSNKSRFSKGDLLFGKLRPYFHKVSIAPTDGICSTDILVIRYADSTYREFMYFSLFQDDVIQFVSDASGGMRMPRTNWATLAGFDCIVPSQPVACAFGEIVAPMIETMMQCVSENNALTKLRDILLPRLISGKLRVEDAESMIEETLA